MRVDKSAVIHLESYDVMLLKRALNNEYVRLNGLLSAEMPDKCYTIPETKEFMEFCDRLGDAL